MVVLNKIYTRTGDKGDTGLGDGARVAKHHARVEAYGAVDEANACLGLARLQLSGPLAAAIGRIQNDLFDVGADLSTPETDADLGYEPLRVSETQVTRLEDEIDALNADLQPLRSFILPGGSVAAATLHLARTVTRRAERRMTELAETEPVNGAALRYMNRLSDLLFVMARHVNDHGAGDILWTPGGNR